MSLSDSDESDVSPASAVLTNPPTSTPIKKTKPIHTCFSTLTRYRNPTMNSIGNQMLGAFVGPMPVDAFLETFLPRHKIPDYHEVTDFRPSVSFQKTCRVEGELAMYAPFIEEMAAFAPQLHFVDTHARGDRNSGYSFEIKPDICIYPRSLGRPPPKKCDVSILDLFIEFKWGSFDDPFTIPSKSVSREQTAFVGTSQSQIDTIGQMGAYVAAQLASQFRTHVFSVFVLHHTARIIRWDREGAIVTEPIPYNVNSSLAEFFSRLSQASPELRGVDTTVTEATGDEAARARKELGSKPDVPMFKTSVPTGDSGSLTVVFAKPSPHPSLPTGRATRACPAYDVFGDRVVFFKDSWRIDVDAITPEGKIYADLNKNSVSFVPTCLASGDVGSQDEQKTQTLEHSNSPWACQKDTDLTPHRHYRLVLDIVGVTLMEFGSSKELVQAIHDALIAHKEAWVVGIIHRDISAGNIVIFKGRGYLIDWDLAKLTSLPQSRRATRTGTWQFMSSRLVKDASAHHTYLDDLESAFWVLLWTALMFSKSKLDIESLSTFIRNTFEAKPGGQEKRSVLMFQTELTLDLFPDRSALYFLLKELADLFKGIYYMPSTDELVAYESLKSRLKDTPDLSSFLKFNFTHLHVTSAERLKDHSYVISCFSRYLNEGPWPSADRAEAQPLSGVNACGEEDGMVILKSKHILSRVYHDEDRKRKRPRLEGSSAS